jgi:Holliday junction resolvase-like predicted endonuclease
METGRGDFLEDGMHSSLIARDHGLFVGIRVRTHNSHQMTIAARAIAAMKLYEIVVPSRGYSSGNEDTHHDSSQTFASHLS